MTTVARVVPTRQRRAATRRHYLMCPPRHFAVAYAINAWMDPTVPVDRRLALRQWEGLVDAYQAYGHTVELLPARRGLADMVFAANGSTVVDGLVFAARFAHPERAAEAGWHARWHRRNGRAVVEPCAVNEAEGDFAVLSRTILAGYGFRTARAAHAELATATGREVVSLELVDPRFYHLDVALCVLDDRRDHLAYYPPAFSTASRRVLASRFPDALVATSADAFAFGLNAVSDGRHVFLPAAADNFATAVAEAGYLPVPIDLSELVKAGGSIKCCTQEIRPPRKSSL